MFSRLVAGGTEFFLDPETGFWGTGGESRLRPIFSEVRGQILAEMRSFRFGTEMLLWYVNPTDACNARCSYCYLPQQIKSRARVMSYAELDRLAWKARDYFGAKGIKGTLIFHGTEPLLLKADLFRLMHAHAGALHFGLQTNGLLLTQDDVGFLKEHRINAGVSLDAPEEKTNDALRGAGHFQKINAVLDWFDGYKGLNVVTTVTRRNVSRLKDMLRFLHGKRVGLCLMNPVRGTQEPARALRPDIAELAKEFRAAVEEALRLTKEGQRIVIADFANILLGIVAPTARLMMCDISPCGGGRRFFSVTADGGAYPCGEFIGMPRYLGGNIFEQSCDAILASEPFARVRGRKVEDIGACADCAVRNICGAPCPAEIQATDGTLSAKSYYCEFYKQVIAHAFEIIARDEVGLVLKTSALQTVYRVEAAASPKGMSSTA